MKLGIKSKILFGISFLLIVCTAFNLGYSYKLFVEDKTSYIFEEGLKKAENITDQINSKIAEINVRASFYSLLMNNPTINFEKLIENQNEVIMSGAIEFKNNQSLIANTYTNSKNVARIISENFFDSKEILKEIRENASTLSPTLQSKTWFFSPKPRLQFLVHISKTLAENKLIFIVSDLSSLVDVFIKDHAYTNKIISLTSVRDREENTEWLSKINYKKGQKGAFETTINHQEMLLSYAFVNDKTLVLSAINKADAFGITKFLILKTTFFAIFLIGAGTIAGIYFSSSITYPIFKLTESANKIAEGDFSSDVKIKSSDEIKVLGNTFNFMTAEIRNLLKNKEILIARLEDYSKNLEKMVEQRTIELKEANDFMALMVNSLDQGLLVFDNELKCHPMFTKACDPIFGISPLDKTIPEILNITDEKGIQNLKQWAKIVFSEMIPFESAINLGYRRKISGSSHTDPNYKNVQIDYYPMRDSEHKISNVVMIATDKTTEVQATEMAHEKEAYVSMILKILNNKTQFESFVNEVEEIIGNFKNAYSISEKRIEFDLTMMLFHTLNGGFGIYSMTKLQLLAREYENEISIIKKSNPDPLEYIPFLEGHVQNLKHEFYNFRKELDSLLGTRFATNQRFTEIDRSKILELKNIVEKTGNKNLQQYFSENFVKTPIIKYFNAYNDLCRSAAVKVNKIFKELKFHNSDLKIEAEPVLEFFNVLIHLFRNCIDHGLEDPATRQVSGKSSDGHIDVSFEKLKLPEGNFLLTTISDDGAGIDPEIIRKRFEKINPNVDISHLSDREVIYKIFDPFFSTRDEVSDLSGRGVGMSAIKEVVERLNGQIEIDSVVGKGTIFTFKLPIN